MDQLPRLGKRELICLLLFTCNYVVSVLRGFLFLWVFGMGYVILLWHSLSLPYKHYGCRSSSGHYVVSLSKTNLLPKSAGNTQEAAAPSQHDCKIVYQDVKNQINQTNQHNTQPISCQMYLWVQTIRTYFLHSRVLVGSWNSNFNEAFKFCTYKERLAYTTWNCMEPLLVND